MDHFDRALTLYSESGLRTLEDWISRGRDILSGIKPRLDITHRGQLIPLYSRDQTQFRPRAERRDIETH